MFVYCFLIMGQDSEVGIANR